MRRAPVAAVRVHTESQLGEPHVMLVVCNDGSTWSYCADEDVWKEAAPLPGSRRWAQQADRLVSETPALELVCPLDGERCDGACDRHGIECDAIELPRRQSEDDLIELDFSWEVDDEGNALSCAEKIGGA